MVRRRSANRWKAAAVTNRIPFVSILIAGVLAAPGPFAYADITIYKCVDSDGRIEFKEATVGTCKALDPPKAKVVRIGMSAAQATKAWGEPSRVHRTITSRGTSEQWVYGSSTYLYFENGRLTAIQD